MRFGREKTPVMTTAETPFEVGKINTVWESSSRQGLDGRGLASTDVVVFATGPLLYNSLLAARELERENIQVVVANVHTIKPLDRETIVSLARAAGAVVTVEEHQIAGGLGGATTELLAKECPVPIEFIGVQDQFGQSGTPVELIEYFSMGVSHIVAAIKKVIDRKEV